MGVFGSSGVRGVVNDDLTPAFVERLAAAVGTEWEASRVAIGRDPRLSGPMLVRAAAAGFMSAGVRVDLVGVAPTPALQDHLGRAGVHGCMVTASHNPPEYNGLKLFDSSGRELSGEDLTRIERAVERRSRRRAQWDRIGDLRRIDAITERYVAGIVADVDAAAIGDRELTVAVDPGHGAASETTPHLCRELGCRVVSVHADADGRFPGRDPEPVPDNLDTLQRLVRASGADLGVAHDGDGDRAVFVDATGEIVDGDSTLALLASALVDEGDTVVTAVNASQRVIDAVRAAGGRIERTPIGSAQLVERIGACRARGDRVPLAGESNGGIFLPEDRPARDGAYVLARMLELVGERPLHERAGEHVGYHMERRSVRYDSPGERSRMVRALEDVAAGTEAEVDRTDGVRLAFPDGWVLARPSGTEPLIRISAEAPDPDRARRYLDRMLAAVEG